MEPNKDESISNKEMLLEKLASAEEALISSEKKFKFLFDYSSDEIFLADLNGRFIEINKRACFPDKLIMNADSGELEIIFNNLLSNAVKYNKENGTIKFSIKEKGKIAIFKVEDTGIGMTDKEQDLLFKEFTRIKTQKTKNISGSGLGLSIMKKVIDLNKGKIKVESKADIGSVFTVKLPIISIL